MDCSRRAARHVEAPIFHGPVMEAVTTWPLTVYAGSSATPIRNPFQRVGDSHPRGGEREGRHEPMGAVSGIPRLRKGAR